MDFAGGVVAFVDVGDFPGQEKAHGSPTGSGHVLRHRRRVLVLQAEESFFHRFQLRAHLRQPAGMGDVARAHYIHPLQLRPFPQVLEGQVFAGGPAVVGVEVEVGGEMHFWYWRSEIGDWRVVLSIVAGWGECGKLQKSEV